MGAALSALCLVTGYVIEGEEKAGFLSLVVVDWGCGGGWGDLLVVRLLPIVPPPLRCCFSEDTAEVYPCWDSVTGMTAGLPSMSGLWRRGRGGEGLCMTEPTIGPPA